MRLLSPRARWRSLLMGLLLLAGAPLGGCCGDAGGASLVIGAEAPDFDLPSVHGGDGVTLSDLRGHVVLVNFWASWCGPCQMEIPELEDLWNRYEEQGLVVVGVSTDGTAQDAQSFLEQVPVSYPMVWDEDGRVSNTYKVMSLPRNVIIDREGRVRSRHDGYDQNTIDTMRREIGDLLEESP